MPKGLNVVTVSHVTSTLKATCTYDIQYLGPYWRGYGSCWWFSTHWRKYGRYWVFSRRNTGGTTAAVSTGYSSPRNTGGCGSTERLFIKIPCSLAGIGVVHTFFFPRYDTGGTRELASTYCIVCTGSGHTAVCTEYRYGILRDTTQQEGGPVRAIVFEIGATYVQTTNQPLSSLRLSAACLFLALLASSSFFCCFLFPHREITRKALIGYFVAHLIMSVLLDLQPLPFLENVYPDFLKSVIQVLIFILLLFVVADVAFELRKSCHVW